MDSEIGYRCACTEDNVVRGCQTHDAGMRQAEVAAPLEWCEDRATSLSHGTEEEAFEIVHACRHEHGHAGAHECWLCTFAWHMEVCS